MARRADGGKRADRGSRGRIGDEPDGRPALLRGGPVRTGSGRGPRLLFARGLANLAAAAFEHLRARRADAGPDLRFSDLEIEREAAAAT